MDTYRDDREELRVAALNKWATDLDQKLEALNAEVRNSQDNAYIIKMKHELLSNLYNTTSDNR